MQQPSIGRVVHVKVPTLGNNGADVAPAVITRVWEGGLVNLRVLLDGTDTPWLTSVPIHEDKAAADEAGGVPAAYWPGRV